jgi:hypothetical protein
MALATNADLGEDVEVVDSVSYLYTENIEGERLYNEDDRVYLIVWM